MAFSGMIDQLVNQGVLQRVTAPMGVNTDPAYQQPAGPNSIVPQTNNPMTNAAIQAGLEYTPNPGAASNSISGIFSRVANNAVDAARNAVGLGADPAAAQQAAVSPAAMDLGPVSQRARDAAGIMRPDAIRDTFSFASPQQASTTVPGSLGEAFRMLTMRRFQPQQQAAPAPVPQATLYSPRAAAQVASPFIAPEVSQNNTLNRFLQSRQSGGIADLLAARGGV